MNITVTRTPTPLKAIACFGDYIVLHKDWRSNPEDITLLDVHAPGDESVLCSLKSRPGKEPYLIVDDTEYARAAEGVRRAYYKSLLTKQEALTLLQLLSARATGYLDSADIRANSRLQEQLLAAEEAKELRAHVDAVEDILAELAGKRAGSQ